MYEILRVVKLVVFTLIIMPCLCCCHSNQPKYMPDGPFYYSDWASYKKPYQPLGKISHGEAMEREKQGVSYYSAYFNRDGQITIFKKHLNGKVEFMEEYFYKDKRLQKSIMTDRDGSKIETIH